MTSTPRFPAITNFMHARHQIYLKRKAGLPGPWTDDPILQNGRFCNIYRELDSVTQWIDKNIREPYANHPHLWFMLCIARYINWPPTLGYLIDLTEKQNVAAWPSHPDFECGLNNDRIFEGSTLCWALTQMAKEGQKVYTGAYMIRAESDPNKPWYSWSKHHYIADIVLGRLWEDREIWREYLTPEPAWRGTTHTLPTLEQVWDKFQEPRYVGWGPFMAYEVVTDMRHTHYLENAPDIFTWANAGPGAIRGLNRLYGRELKAQPKKEQTRKEMEILMTELNLFPGLSFVFGDGTRFEMRDIEHSLCEFDKYERVRLGEGTMRAKYNWQDAQPLVRGEVKWLL
jgi:hypothetical protein